MKKPASYYQLKPGEWVFPKKRGYLLQCCDCGKVHRMDFSAAVETGRGRGTIRFMTLKGDIGVAFRVFHAKAATERARKKSSRKRGG